MKVEKSEVTKITIKDVDGLDPVSLLIEEFDRGQAKVMIECYGESWSSYWGSMGGDAVDFFTRTNVEYLVNCFERGIRQDTDELDTIAMGKNFIKEVRALVIEKRYEQYITKETARTIYDECVRLADNLDDIAPEHPYDNWKLDISIWNSEDEWRDVFYDNEDFTDWMINHCPEIYITNGKYEYLHRIVTVVKDVIMNHYKESQTAA